MKEAGSEIAVDKQKEDLNLSWRDARYYRFYEIVDQIVPKCLHCLHYLHWLRIRGGLPFGDVLMWDQRAVMHRGTPWPYEQPRKLSSICSSAQEQDGLASIRL